LGLVKKNRTDQKESDEVFHACLSEQSSLIQMVSKAMQAS
jgi:hypothetical protein